MQQKRSMISISIIVSVYNEQDVLELFWQETRKVIDRSGEFQFKLMFVNDGSIDNSANIIDQICKNNANVGAIHFSKNFGHEAAMLAGIQNSDADAYICMDADLQHPPKYIMDMCNAYRDGFEIIMMNRDSRDNMGLLKRITSPVFYRIINMLSDKQFEHNASDFFLISHRVSEIICNQYTERTRFLRGLIQSVGFKKKTIIFNAPKRIAGESKYSIRKLFFFSLTAIASSSHIPLRLGIGIGVLFGIISFIVAVFSIVMWYMGQPYAGYTTIVVLMSLGFSLLFIVLGVIGEYIGYIFNEVKKRPIYIIDRKT